MSTATPAAATAPDGALDPGGNRTRERIVNSSAELLRRHGYAATGIKRIAAESGATFGSIYHFFPGGKEELADQVLRTGGAFFGALYESFSEAGPNLRTAVRDFFAGAGDTLRETGYQDACPIATVAGEVASSSEPLRVACAEVFEGWLGLLARDLRAEGATPAAARSASLAILAALEGAFLLCRTLRSTEPMEAAAEAAVGIVEAATAPGEGG
jgi:AcrR family transcriptional regulator